MSLIGSWLHLKKVSAISSLHNISHLMMNLTISVFKTKKTLAYSYPTHLDIFGSSRKVRETNREEPNEHKEETVISVAISKALGNFNLVIESLKFTC